jgi:putative transposase
MTEDAEVDALACVRVPAAHRTTPHSPNPIQRLSDEIKRRTDVAGIVPNGRAIIRLLGAILPEQNVKWAVQRSCCTSLRTIAPSSDDPVLSLPALAT